MHKEFAYGFGDEINKMAGVEKDTLRKTESIDWTISRIIDRPEMSKQSELRRYSILAGIKDPFGSALSVPPGRISANG